MCEFKEKVVLVTGGSSGIGQATARKFAESNAKVFICGRNEDKLYTAKELLSKDGLHIQPIKGDVSKTSDCQDIIKAVINQAGKLDILVNSAGVYVEGPSDTMTEEMWDSLIDINLKGTFFMIRYAIPYLEESKGCIVNVSSDAGIVGNTSAAIYCASKGGVTLLTKALALELIAKGIRVNAVCPSEVDTPMLDREIEKINGMNKIAYIHETLLNYPTGTNRIVSPEEVAECIAFLASNKTSAINGTCLSIDFGITAGY